ncbi:MAG: DUF6266 family protein [Bacteroidales bacterium]|nr:DUF6266 family protein [Bacteroidales bacterium]
MAKVNLFSGMISGKIGKMVVVNGKNGVYVRSLPTPNDKKSEGQLKQRSKMQQANAFLKPLKDFLKLAFVERKPNQNAYQAATSSLMRTAFTEETLDYGHVRISEGSLCPAKKGSVSVSDHVAIFRWEDNSDEIAAKDNDKAVVLLYDPQQEVAFWEVKKETRKDKYCLQLIDNDLTGEFIAYLAFTNKKEDRISNSLYLGTIQVEEHIGDDEEQE